MILFGQEQKGVGHFATENDRKLAKLWFFPKQKSVRHLLTKWKQFLGFSQHENKKILKGFTEKRVDLLNF